MRRHVGTTHSEDGGLMRDERDVIDGDGETACVTRSDDPWKLVKA